MRDDDLLQLLGQLDPAGSDPPPAPGSPRYTAIKEHAMSTSTLDPESTDIRTGGSLPQTRRPWQRGRFLVAAAAAVAVVVTIGVLRPGGEPSAAASIRAAADELAEVTRLRADMHVDNTFFGTGDIALAVSGRDNESVWEMTMDDGAVVRERIVTVDGYEYRVEEDGSTTRYEVDNLMIDQEGGSFAESSAAVVTAVLEDADVQEVGSDDVRGVEATHYRLALTDAGESALGALPDQQLEWFGLIIGEDGLGEDVTVDIWVADGLVRRFDVSSPSYGTQSIELYDFDADIAITAPPGPYADPATVEG